MRPLDLYDFGVQMAASNASEAQQRNAINRIYYGLHHEACCRYFRTEQSARPLNRNKRHTDLRDRFNRPEHPAAGRIAQFLGSLMMLRSEADYQLNIPLRYRNRNYSPTEMMHESIFLGQDLKRALDVYSPGDATERCECRQAYSSG